ncbi:MAG: hypothetical protein A2Z96_03265 [Spirochaetes bacterium GWB1_48_6]|nr:MAG: hypothetical protein A2Z96_03265 [Spirochaetes bacterium GWB1_48_6]
MTEQQGIWGPGPRTELHLNDLILGESRAGVFLQTPENFNIPRGKSPWTETLLWKPEYQIITPDQKQPAQEKENPLFLDQGKSSPEVWLEKAQNLWTQGWRNLALICHSTDLEFLTGLQNQIRLPIILQVENTHENVSSVIMGALACGVEGVLAPFTNLETWEELYPQLKSLVFSLEKELIRPPLKKIVHIPEQTQNPGNSRTVAFQGERGAYSELAVFSLFDPKDTSAIPMKAFRDVYEAVLKGEVDYGLLPLENALAGSIHDNFDLLLQYPDLHIVAETQIRIEHNLIGLPGATLQDIKKVYSHPQGLAQSAAFLDQHPEWERVPFYDTAGSVAYVAEQKDPTLAGIASAVAAKFYGMEILKSGVETNPRNFTRFALIAPLGVTPLGLVNKASLVFSTAHSPGALSDCLSILSQHQLNMRKIESRPIHGKPWSYMFYVDVEVPADMALFDAARKALTEKASEFRLLGAYPSR